MMDLIIFTKGLTVGFIMCAPFGPIGLLCLRKTLMEGRFAGAVSVLGASTVDGIYCVVAGLGLTWISNFLVEKKLMIQMLGSVVLILLGIAICLARTSDPSLNRKTNGHFSAFSSTFFLMLGNPLPILLFTATFTALGIHGWKGDYLLTAVLVMGVFTGSSLWAPLFAFMGSVLPSVFNPRRLKKVNQISGIIVVGFGLSLGIMSLCHYSS
jgi:threonine/homoserine/homoserine lactone efflux protein